MIVKLPRWSDMKFYLKYIFLSLTLVLSLTTANAQSDEPQLPYPDYEEDVFMDMELEENLVTPAVPKEAQKAVSGYMSKTAKSLKNRFTIDMTRNDDVFVVVVPTDELFLPNDTLFISDASKRLAPILDLLKDPYMFKVVVALHTDDTGSEAYRQSLSLARINSVYDWLMDEIDAGRLSEDVVIVPYAMGSNSPLVANDTRKNRKENRRLEFYFIPGPRLIENAINKKLK